MSQLFADIKSVIIDQSVDAAPYLTPPLPIVAAHENLIFLEMPRLPASFRVHTLMAKNREKIKNILPLKWHLVRV